MFKNKRKTDYQVRFQDPKFRQKLQQARTYKRFKKTLPLTETGIILSKIGLGSWLSRIGTLLGFFVLIYLVYIPNIFFIKHLTINGANPGSISAVEQITNSYLGKKTPWPQKNLILLSKSKLADYLLKNDQKILGIDSISKSFPNSLTINITPRIDKFAITASGSPEIYSVSNDGIITGILTPTASGTIPSGLIPIRLTANGDLYSGKSLFNKNQISFFVLLQNKLPGIVKSPVDYYELGDSQNQNLTVYTKNGFKLLFDLSSDLNKTLNRLGLLFSQFSDADIKKLYYVDMRFEDRGYVCDLGTPCSITKTIPSIEATSTPN
jgi:hypothetical protein